MTVGSARVRIDKQHPEVQKAQVQVAVAVRRATKDAGLERRLVELVNVRVSQINGCSFCLDVHVRDALLEGETSQRLAVLPAWRETELFTDEERAALAIAELVTTLPGVYESDREYSAAADVLTPEQLSAVTWVAITINTFNRISILSRHEVRPRADGNA